MNYRKNMNLYDTTLRAMNIASRMLNEDFAMNAPNPAAVQGQSMPMAEMPEMAEQQEEEGMSQDTIQYVDQIREIALNGIQQYSKDVDSEEYDFFKKVWLMCDKLESTKDKMGDE